MALVDNAFYVDSVGYTAVTAWATGTAKAAGALVRATAPSVGNERVFVCIVAGTTHATTEPTWTNTRGAKTTDNTVTWQECTGIAAINGDATNTPSWTITATPPGGVKNTAVSLGQVIKRDSAASYQICTTAGTAGNAAEPGFSNTAGTTTADGTVTWTSLGVVGNFTGNQAPHARIANSMASTWAQAGNKIFVKSSHAETQATTITWAGTGTQGFPNLILCHGGAAYPPTATTTGATVTASGNSTNVTFNGFYYVEGIAFTHSGTGSSFQLSNSPGISERFKNCSFTLSANSSTSSINVGPITGSANGMGHVVMDNCPLSFANASQVVGVLAVMWEWFNTASALAGTIPTVLLQNSGGATSGTIANFRGLDLSAAGSGKTLVGAGVGVGGRFTFTDCKLGSSVAVAATIIKPQHIVDVVNCDSGALNYRNERHNYEGDLTTEITIVRTGGASDGTTPVSWKIITTANATFTRPFECPPIAIWNDGTGSPVDLTIEGIWGGGAVPNDDEIWVEVEYLGSGSFPVSSIVSDAKASIQATAAGQAASSETWGGSTTDFNLSVTFTPAMKGFVYARVKVGKASATFYVDPRITLS